MKVRKFVNGFLKENTYIIYENEYALLVDPGTINKDVEDFVSKNKLNILGILITHYHFDHVGGLEYFKDKYKCDVFDYKSNKDIDIKKFKFKIIDCFGHTLDSVIFYFEEDKIIFSGDFIFKDTIGNYDLENENIMYSSLKKFKEFNEDIIIYPGHGDFSNVGYEIMNNIYLREIL